MSTMLAVDPALHIALRGALAVLFFWAAAHKLRDVAGFRAALAAYQLLPRRGVEAAAALLISAEVGAGAGLLVPFDLAQDRTGLGAGTALAAAGLLCAYTGAIVINLLRGRRHIDCGCVGVANRRSLRSGLVGRNGVLIAAALVGTLPATSRSLTSIDAVTIGAGVTALVLLYTAIDGLIANAPRIAALARDRVPHGLVETHGRQVDHA